MPRKPSIDESKLSKGELRKLNALRKSVGDVIADRAFMQWQARRSAANGSPSLDRTADAIADAVRGLIESRKIKVFPRGGYLVKRGRGRVLVARAH